jgi:hypothetical protein
MAVIFFIPFLFASWQPAVVEGLLDSKHLKESSGLEFIDAWYHINDSGDGPYIYRNQRLSDRPEKIKIKGLKVFDPESLGHSACGKSTCLVIADIGDNLSIRNKVSLFFIKLEDLKTRDAKVFHQLDISYPDARSDAEAISFDTNGDLILIAKLKPGLPAKKAQVYKLAKSRLFSNKLETLEKIDTLDVAAWFDPNQKPSKYSHLVTGLDIDKAGNWYVLAYHSVFVLNKGKGKPSTWKREVLPIDRKVMRQSEAIHYMAKENKIIVTTELAKNKSVQPIYAWYGVDVNRNIATQKKAK